MQSYNLYKDIAERTEETYTALSGLYARENQHLSNGLWICWCSRILMTRAKKEGGRRTSAKQCRQNDHDDPAKIRSQ